MMTEGLEYSIVVSHGEKIVEAISTDPKGLALSLHAKRLISDTDFEETNELNETKTAKARRLYSAVKKRIQHHPGRYDDFIRTFKDSGELHCDLLKALNDSEDAGKMDLVRHGSESNISEDSGMDNISINSLSVNCQCPCGVTDFSHYLCPPPDCLANRHSSIDAFSELDLGDDSADKKKAESVLQQHLSEETESIQHKFTTYSMAVYHWTKSIRGIDDSLKQILRTRQQSIRSDNFEDLYASVTAGIDFINYESLGDHVMEACRNTSDDGEKSNRLQKKAEDAAKTYENAFRKYSQLRVVLLPSSIQDICSDNQEVTLNKELKIKIEEDFRKFPLKRITHFKKVVRKLLNLPDDVLLRVTSVERGCVEMSFEIVGVFPGELLNLSLEQKKALVAENITLMEYAGMMQYCCCELLDNEVSRVVVQDLYEKVYQADYQQDNLDDVDLEIDENEHSPDCPCIQGGEVTCQLSSCLDCEAQFRHCALEYHMLDCEKREAKLVNRVFPWRPAPMVTHERPTQYKGELPEPSIIALPPPNQIIRQFPPVFPTNITTEKVTLGIAPTFSFFSKCISGVSVVLVVASLLVVALFCATYVMAKPTDGKPRYSFRDYRYQSRKVSAELFLRKTRLQCIDGRTAVLPFFYYQHKNLDVHTSPTKPTDVMSYNTTPHFATWCIQNVTMISLSENIVLELESLRKPTLIECLTMMRYTAEERVKFFKRKATMRKHLECLMMTRYTAEERLTLQLISRQPNKLILICMTQYTAEYRIERVKAALKRKPTLRKDLECSTTILYTAEYQILSQKVVSLSILNKDFDCLTTTQYTAEYRIERVKAALKRKPTLRKHLECLTMTRYTAEERLTLQLISKQSNEQTLFCMTQYTAEYRIERVKAAEYRIERVKAALKRKPTQKKHTNTHEAQYTAEERLTLQLISKQSKIQINDQNNEN